MRTTVGEVQINYLREGDGPAVVLTHGLGGDLESWQPLAEALRDRYTVLRWDVRGFGASDKPPGPVTPSVWAADLAALLDTLGIARAVIAGISLGGVVSQRFALDFPDQTRGLILISTSSEVGVAAGAAWQERARLVEAEGMLAAVGDGPSLSYSRGYREAHAGEIAAAATETAARNDPRDYAAACRAVSGYNFTAELSRIACPTLILQGLEDELTPPGGSVIMSRRIPNARLELIERCGHGIPGEQPAELLRLIEEFLASL